MPPRMTGEMRPPGPAEQVGPAPAAHHAPRTGLKGDWEWLQFAAQLPGKPVALQPSAGGQLAFPGRCVYLGLNLINAATTAGRVAVYDGQDTTGPLIDVATVSASGIVSASKTASGVLCEIGVFVQLTTANVTGSVIVVPLWHYGFTAPGS